MASACRILLVDDDSTNRRTLRWFFENAGFDVLEAATGTEALHITLERKPDLIVLDINLPDMTGFEVCRQLKSNPATVNIGVVHISAIYVASGYRTEGLESGADAYLVKPFEPSELLATVRSLQRIRAAEEAARFAAQQWRTTFDAISDGLCLVNEDGAILRCNRALCEMLGRRFSYLLGQPLGRMLQEAFQLPQLPALNVLPIRGTREVVEMQMGSRWFRVTSDPIRGDDGRVTGAVLILTDVTERKDLEEQLRQGQKLEAIGRLAGGVAHDFNNLLTAILGNASLLARSLPKNEPERDLVTTIERAAGRAAELTRQLLGFSRKTLLWLAPTNLNDAVREVVGIVQRTIDPRIRLDVRSDPGLWQVHADPGQMAQVLMNLCLNACDAMPHGGQLRLETANVVLTEEQVRGRVEATAGDFVRMRISDTGAGIPADVLPRIFDPFFTTKEPGKGTGLGLAMVFGIVKQHQGWIDCHSQMGQGTAFEIYLPRLSEVPANPLPIPATSAGPGGGTETILVAEDNDMLRDLARTLLRQNGFHVLLAEDGQQAVDLYAREAKHIDLVLLDLNMPRMSGLDALREIRRIDPGARVVLSSGYSDAEPAQVEQGHVQGFIGKPFRERDLLHAVRTALDGAGPEMN